MNSSNENIEIYDLWQEYIKTKDINMRNTLVEKYIPLVKIVAGRLGLSLPSYVDKDDFLSMGFFGLIQSIERFDPDRGVKFETFATVRIRGAILDALRVQDWIPTSIRQKVKQYQTTIRFLEDKLGRSATDKEIADELSLSEEQLSQFLSEIQIATVIPLEDFSKAEESGFPGQNNYSDDYDKSETKEVLAQSIDKLPEKERLVMSLYYYEELTLKEISVIMNLSEARISQLHTKAIFRLRAALGDMKTSFA